MLFRSYEIFRISILRHFGYLPAFILKISLHPHTTSIKCIYPDTGPGLLCPASPARPSQIFQVCENPGESKKSQVNQGNLIVSSTYLTINLTMNLTVNLSVKRREGVQMAAFCVHGWMYIPVQRNLHVRMSQHFAEAFDVSSTFDAVG